MAKAADITQKDLDKLKKSIMAENRKILEDFAKKIDKVHDNARKLIDDLHGEQDKRLEKLEQSLSTHRDDLNKNMSRLSKLEKIA